MDKKTAAAQVNADYTQDQLQAQTDKALYDLGVISGLAYQQVKEHGRPVDRAARAQPAAARCEPEGDRSAACLAADQRSTRPRRCSIFIRSRRKRSGSGRTISGTLAPLATPVQVGQHVTAGTSVAEVIQLDKLKAALQIAETQARDIQIGQPASIDTHNGVIPGHVTRIDPSVVNGTRTVDVAT
jgi:HlyD family secretion protein